MHGWRFTKSGLDECCEESRGTVGTQLDESNVGTAKHQGDPSATVVDVGGSQCSLSQPLAKAAHNVYVVGVASGTVN